MEKTGKFYLNVIFNAFLSGIMIGIGGAVFLLCENKIVGSFLFSFGLFTIIQRGFALYTGKVGYIPEKPPIYIAETLVTFLGNMIGTGCAAGLLHLTRFGSALQEKASASMEVKSGDTIASQLVLGIFCGMLMYLAVDNGRECRKKSADASFVFGTFVPVMVFIICGFNHSVADTFYMFAAGTFPQHMGYIMVVVVGNAIGGMLIPFIKKVSPKLPAVENK